MKFKNEIFIAKVIAFILIFLTLWEISAFGASRQSITNLYLHYNRKLTQEQAKSFTDITFRAGAKYHVSPALIASIIVCESSACPSVVSKTGDYGLMQIHYSAHKNKVTKRHDLFNPETNIFLGTRIFAQLRKKYSLTGALTHYSGGSKAYAKKVMKTLRSLKGEK